MIQEFDFYQKIMPIGILKKVGRVKLPTNTLSWLFAVKKELSICNSKDLLDTPNFTNLDTIQYNRVRTITGDIFLAVVYSIKK